MESKEKIQFSVLDLSPIVKGATAADAFRNSLDLAQHAEKWGYKRYWLAEHHNMPGIASAATAVVIAHVAGGTQTIRVGSGGVMLPNHAPLVIAEQFGTLASLFPGRIDLGLGRAPGTDPLTARALRRNLEANSEQFPEDVVELLGYFEDAAPGQKIQAVPGSGLRVPIWLLGSSLNSAQLAAILGLPFAFASHFAPDALMQALAIYRSRFKPSKYLEQPYVMLGVNVIATETDDEARRMFTSLQQQFINLRRGTPGMLPPPIEDISSYGTVIEKANADHALAYSVLGDPATVKQGLTRIIESTGANELMITGHIHDHVARLRSFEITADARKQLATEGPAPAFTQP